MNKKRRNKLILQSAILLLLLVLALLFLINYGKFSGFVIYQSQPDATSGLDTYLRENSTTTFATDTAIKIGKTAGGIDLRGLIQFNLTSIPPGDTITSGVLELYNYFSNSPNNITITAYRLNSPWDESSAQWYNSTSSTLWNSVGGDYDPSPLGSIIVSNVTKWYNLTITSTVHGWTNGTYENDGLILIASGEGAGDFKEFYSSDYAVDSTLTPIIFIDHTPNAAPNITSLTTDSSIISPKIVGQSVTFTAQWTDIDSINEQLFVCNSSAINATGCGQTTYCSTSMSTSNPLSCSYTTTQSNNRTTKFWAGVCDGNNCSVQNSSFFVDHFPSVKLIQPNGGETVNQSLGNYPINFNVNDSDSDKLMANIYYAISQNSTANLIVLNLNLTLACTDVDGNTKTTNNCTYMWNSTGITGNYYLTINVNDSYTLGNATSDNSFVVSSLFDNVPPLINATWLSESAITSGKFVQVFANITEDNMNAAWVTINSTPLINISMTNLTNNLFNASFIAPAPGMYSWIVYAVDRNGNLNQSLSQTFNVTAPIATAQNLLAPDSNLPYTAVQISAQLNASDGIRDAYAYLNVPNGFIFLSNYPQNYYSGNYTANQTKTINWFVSTPISQGNYSVNVTFSDYYGNAWNIPSRYIVVNNSANSQDIYANSVSGYPIVQTTGTYLTQSLFTKNGLPAAADSALVTIYDAIGNLIVGPASMSNPSLGTYNYSYTIGSSVNEGQWETIINDTKNGVSYYGNTFWKVVGGPFDVRDITIDNPTVSALQISVTTINTGGATKDLTLAWNLTNENTGQMLDSGADTFAVNANSQRIWTIHPNTNFIGQAKITFMGTYSGTEKAGAFKIFSTTSGNESGGGGTGGGGGGGGGGGSNQVMQNLSTPSNAGFEISGFGTGILIAKNIKQEVNITIVNTGQKDLTNVSLVLENLDHSYYTLSPSTIDRIKAGKTGVFTLDFLVDDFTGDKQFNYIVNSNELQKIGQSKISVLLPGDYISLELQYLQKQSALLRAQTTNKDILAKLDQCDAYAPQINDYLQKEELINAKENLDSMTNCIDIVQASIKQPSPVVNIGGYGIPIILLIVGIVLVIGLIILIIVAYRKMNLLLFARKGDKVKPSESAKNRQFDDRIKELERELNEDEE